MIFTLLWVSTYLYRQWFSHKMKIQEKVIYTDNGFYLKSDFMKKLSTQTIPLKKIVHYKFQPVMYNCPLLILCNTVFLRFVCLPVVELKTHHTFLQALFLDLMCFLDFTKI